MAHTDVGTGMPARRSGAGLAVDVLGQYATAPLARRALVCGYALLPETQAAAAADVIAARVPDRLRG